ncbi:hypothetical protein K3495_g1831 [Podosphaera aphanis]|nr:hypothetical protein K3495_g1831 [Podosphaera aphanis]
MSSDSEQSEYRQISCHRPVSIHYTSSGDNLVRNNNFEKELFTSQRPPISKKRIWRQESEGFSQRSRDSNTQDSEYEGQVCDAPFNNKRRRIEFRENTQFHQVQETERSAGEYFQFIQQGGREAVSEEIFKVTKRLVVHHLLVKACVVQRLGTTEEKGALHEKLADICSKNRSTWKYRTLKALTAWVEAQI